MPLTGNEMNSGAYLWCSDCVKAWHNAVDWVDVVSAADAMLHTGGCSGWTAA